jgi:hypothetical protein
METLPKPDLSLMAKKMRYQFTNRMLVTETLPINMRGGGTRIHLTNCYNQEKVKHCSISPVVEYTSNLPGMPCRHCLT